MALFAEDLDPVGPDLGCDLAQSCLGCPFDHCLQEEPGGSRLYERAKRDNRIARQFREGKATYTIARELGLSQRTIQRSLARSRNTARKLPMQAGGR